MHANRVLSREQRGHLRHIENLSLQLRGDWAHMAGRRPGQEDFGSFRFQLAFMAYALALAHRHRLPNAPALFKPTFERLIEKMLHPDVWMYWRNVSRGGAPFNAHLADTLHEEWDPVVKDNIMYSAYVHSMALLYAYLFNDRRYEAEGSLSFCYMSPFWLQGEKRFDYDQKKLNQNLYWQMVESGYLGIACEPNCIFQICNQPAILGFRMHDLVYGGDIAGDVTRNYQQAWAEFGRLDQGGHYNMMVLRDSRTVIGNDQRSPWVDAWLGTLMNMWNRDFVRHHYASQIQRLLLRAGDGTASVAPPAPSELYGVTIDDVDTGDFGFAASWASEMGDQETLDALLAHADRFLAPTWSRGGLFYPRNDMKLDAAGNYTLVEPLVGNALLAYARLNVPDGMFRLYNEPWGPDHFAEPLLTALDPMVDVLRADFDRATRRLTFILAPRDDRTTELSLRIDNAGPAWRLERDGATVTDGIVRTQDAIELQLHLDRESTFVLAALQ